MSSKNTLIGANAQMGRMPEFIGAYAVCRISRAGYQDFQYEFKDLCEYGVLPDLKVLSGAMSRFRILCNLSRSVYFA